ncbi:MAG: Asp-tRNA(Asn)/Glu-tRNA(Gln) amidotransferase subunit GatA [Deltaproteobacteria bacterium]|nr:Asp-tRNA(Asn)/Glu-tRNA(Gln) amidotransferase subunit GatA [Deltaproteobacteria bacterium]
MSLYGIKKAVLSREISCVEAADAFLRRIDALNPEIGAYLTVTRAQALDAARRSDDRIGAGRRDEIGHLEGIPIALKDNIATDGVRTTCASRMLDGYVPPYDATVVSMLKQAGAVLLGKLNMDEFSMGSSNFFSAFGPCRNPWDLSRTPGGSSGGPAAAVAARMAAGSLGTDTGGSVRQPASFCGVVGLRPTYGRVSRFGLIAFASSLDQIGPVARDVRDCAILLDAVAGYDPRDSTSMPTPVPDYLHSLGENPAGLRIGLPREYLDGGCDPEVAGAVRKAVETFAGLGCRVEEVSLPHHKHCVATYYLLASAEASTNLARYDGVRFGFRAPKTADFSEMYTRSRTEAFGPEVKRRIMLGTHTLSAGYRDEWYLKAQKVRTLIAREFAAAFRSVDLIAGPTSPAAAWRLADRTDDPLAMYLSDACTVPASLAGLPGISVPCGFTRDGLPIGLQLAGRQFDEETVFRAAFAYEQTARWNMTPPSLGHSTTKSAE